MLSKEFLEFLDEFGFEYPTVKILYDNNYISKETINNILSIYEGYLEDKYDWDCALDMIQEDEIIFRGLSLNGYSIDICSYSIDEFINEYVDSEYKDIKFDRVGLTKKEICKKYIELFIKNVPAGEDFIYTDELILVIE